MFELLMNVIILVSLLVGIFTIVFSKDLKEIAIRNSNDPGDLPPS